MAHVVRPDGIDFFDLVAESHRLVNQKLNEIMRGRFSGQQFEFPVDPMNPSAADACANLWRWGRRCQKNNQGTIAYDVNVQEWRP